MNACWESTKVENSAMRLYLCLPDDPTPAPGIIVVHGQTGVQDFLEVTRMIAGAGYVAVAPDLYHRDPPECKDDAPTRRSRLRDLTVIDDINAAANFLNAHQSVAAGQVGIVGFCMGGRVVYLTSAASPAVKAGVMYYGGDTMRAWGDGPSPFERTADIHGPILGHFGADDLNPSPQDMRRLDAELNRHGKTHEFFSYDGAEHAFANLGSAKYREHAARASWPRTFAFFAQHLRRV